MIQIKPFSKGFIDAVPVGISVLIYGIVFGVLAQKAGLPISATIAMSALIFAGASQMTAIQMISMGSNPLAIIITVFIINLRHFLMAASLSQYLSEVPTRTKLVNAYFLTDESYAVTYFNFQKSKPSAEYFLGSSLNIYLFWCSATIIGFLFGNFIPAQLNHILNFAFAAAFIGMLVPMIKDFPSIVTVLVSGVISILGYLYLPGKWYIVIAAIVASFFGYWTSLNKPRKTLQKEFNTYEL